MKNSALSRFLIASGIALSLFASAKAFAIPTCPNWNGTAFIPAAAVMPVSYCSGACAGGGAYLDPWSGTNCAAVGTTCPIQTCLGVDPTAPSAQCVCPAFGSANWTAMNAVQQTACCGGGPTPTPVPLPPVPGLGPCSAIPAGSNWNTHGCGVGGANCAPSDMPVPAPTPGAVFDHLTNKMSACCGHGWGENSASAQKLDCVEAKAPASPTTQTFVDFYAFADTNPVTSDLTTAGIAHPNELFVVDKNGIPYNGFYTDGAIRCTYQDSITHANVKLKASDQLDLFRTALAARKLPVGPGPIVDPKCCNLIIFALERICPKSSSIAGVTVAKTDTIGTVTARRCTAAKQMKIDFGLIDLCDPMVTRRTRFRVATSFAGEDPEKASVYPIDPINIEDLIADAYPNFYPDPNPPVCPLSPAIYTVPMSGGRCRLRASEDPYPPF